MLNNEQAGKLLKGFCAYVFNGESFESTDRKVQGAFEVIKKSLDSEMRGRELGRTYGRIGWLHAMENRLKSQNDKEKSDIEDSEDSEDTEDTNENS